MKRNLKFTSMMMSVIAIIITSVMLIGVTFAWFNDSTTSKNNIIASGSLDVKAFWADGSIDIDSVEWNDFESKDPIFGKGEIWEPGYVTSRYLKIENSGTLPFRFKLVITPNGEFTKLAEVIDVYYVDSAVMVTKDALSTVRKAGTLAELIQDPDGAAYGVLPATESKIVTIALKMNETAGIDYQNLSIGSAFSITILATQLDEGAEYPEIPTADEWDGTADTSWYNETDTEFALATAEQFAGFAALVADDENNFAGKTITLDADLDLTVNESPYGNSFAPVGTTGERDGSNRLIVEPFKGTFDGNGHTISNLYQSGWDLGYEWGKYGSIGLFSELESATVKNVVINGFECQVEGGDVAFIAGSATGDCVFENIEINNSKIGTYNNGIGSIIGWSGAGNYTFRNITIGEDVVLGGLWGSFDSSVGGVVGQAEPGATYNFENIEISCRLDVYNDVTAAYDYYNYRMSGMIIGRCAKTITIDGVNYPDMSQYNIICDNVTVNYGDWMNYHYCREDGKTGKRVEAGFTYDGISLDYDHSVCTVHHMLCLPFDGLFGGDQYGVKPITEYEGVTVNYPDSYIPEN